MILYVSDSIFVVIIIIVTFFIILTKVMSIQRGSSILCDIILKYKVAPFDLNGKIQRMSTTLAISQNYIFLVRVVADLP